ncbi:MAG: hypothetical protein OCD02_08855 [Spirochaetaceae bacterium]
MKKIILILLSFSLLSCVTTIENLKDEPVKYAGTVVSIRGEVTNKINIPFTDYSLLELTDSTGKIIIFSVNDYNKSDKVRLKTKVIAFDSENLEQSTQNIISSIENFLIEKLSSDKKSVSKASKNIGKTVSAILNKIEATYFLIEVD